jgi:hypothetical protein
MINRNRSDVEIVIAAPDPRSGSSLVPMLVSGLVLIVFGMIAVMVFS